jgi:hypothetical protein
MHILKDIAIVILAMLLALGLGAAGMIFLLAWGFSKDGK